MQILCILLFIRQFWYIDEINGNKYLTLVSNDKNKEVLPKYTELWDKIKDLFKSTTNTSGNCDEKYMKTKFNSDHNLTLGKILSLHSITTAVRSVFQEDNMYYSQVLLDECMYEL